MAFDEICTNDGYTKRIFPTAMSDLHESLAYIENAEKRSRQISCKPGPCDATAVKEVREFVQESIDLITKNVQCTGGHITQFLMAQVCQILLFDNSDKS